MVYWKEKTASITSNALISQIDLMSSLASLVGSQTRGPDSENLLSVLLGESQKGREDLVLEATSRTAFRKGEWVLIPPYEGPAINTQVNIELGNLADYGLYNLKEDMSQQHNLAESRPEILQQMIREYENIRGEDDQEVEPLELK